MNVRGDSAARLDPQLDLQDLGRRTPEDVAEAEHRILDHVL
jgi:hypothetical protein